MISVLARAAHPGAANIKQRSAILRTVAVWFTIRPRLVHRVREMAYRASKSGINKDQKSKVREKD